MTKLTTAFIVEDEPRARTVLQKYLITYCPNIEIIGSTDNAIDAHRLIKQLRPQLLFLDVEISSEESPENSFDLLARLPKYPYEVIFVTAFNHYALQAIKFHALAYLLKPINIEELEEAVAMAIKQIEQKQQNLQLLDFIQRLEQTDKSRQRIWIPNSEGMRAVFVDEIVRLEAAGRCTFLFATQQDRIFSSRNLKEFILMLEDYSFFHVHRSHLVNINHVVEYSAADGGEIILSDQSRVPVSRRRKQAFLQFLKSQ